jgi:lipopolysaccharide export system permease protein
VVKFSAEEETITFNLLSGQIHEQVADNPGEYRISTFKQQSFKVSNLQTRLTESKHDYRGDREMSARQMLENVHEWEDENTEYRSSLISDSDSALNVLMTKPELPQPRLERNEANYMALVTGEAYNENIKISRLFKTRRSQIVTNVKLVAKYQVEIHKKYSLPAACLAFILIGAPLGVVSRGGGMALSVGISIGLFTIYWAFLIGGEQLADRLIVPAWAAMWAANILLVGVGLVLIYWVRNEKSFFETLRMLFWRRNRS